MKLKNVPEIEAEIKEEEEEGENEREMGKEEEDPEKVGLLDKAEDQY